MSAPKVFRAKYSGRCPACTQVIEQDELLMFDQDDQVIHAECIDTIPARRQAEVCPRCFMTKATNGSCACEDA